MTMRSLCILLCLASCLGKEVSKEVASSPPCTWFSKLHNLSRHHYTDKDRTARDTAAKMLLDFGIACCRQQLAAGGDICG